eukprot:jgi/Mesvir1/2378/Mv22132-RA.2
MPLMLRCAHAMLSGCCGRLMACAIPPPPQLRVETECLVWVPPNHVTYTQLVAMQHSGHSVQEPNIVRTNFREFNRLDFLLSCSSPQADPHKPTAPACRLRADAYRRGYQRAWSPYPMIMPDEVCKRRFPVCQQNQQPFPGTNATCCSPATSRCVQNHDPNRPFECRCMPGYRGDMCTEVCPGGCINECSGRGKCTGSWCKCEPGWFGLDCSLPASGNYPEHHPPGSALPPSPPPPRHVSELKIYVYDVPPNVLQSEPCYGCSDLCGGLYNSNNFFLAKLLKDPLHLTTNPDEAHLFFAPLLPYRYSHNLGRVSPHLRDTVAAIRELGYFDRNGGRDHVWYIVGDIQPCQTTHLVLPGIIVAHYGRLDVWGEAWNHDPNHNPCINPQKDVIVPALSPESRAFVRFNEPGAPHHVSYVQTNAVEQAKRVFVEGWMDLPRPTLLTFAGGNPPLGNPACTDPNNNTPQCRDNEYAMGIRAAVFDWFRQHADIAQDVELYNHSLYNEYYPKLRSSKFCFDAPGHGFSVRIMDYLVSGCVPVIVRDDILWPFESYEYGGDVSSNWQQDSAPGVWDDLPRVRYPEFAISLRKKDIPNMLSILRGVSSEELRRLQQGVQKIHLSFLWDEEYGLAYNQTMMALTRLRAKMMT